MMCLWPSAVCSGLALWSGIAVVPPDESIWTVCRAELECADSFPLLSLPAMTVSSAKAARWCAKPPLEVALTEAGPDGMAARAYLVAALHRVEGQQISWPASLGSIRAAFRSFHPCCNAAYVKGGFPAVPESTETSYSEPGQHAFQPVLCNEHWRAATTLFLGPLPSLDQPQLPPDQVTRCSAVSAAACRHLEAPAVARPWGMWSASNRQDSRGSRGSAAYCCRSKASHKDQVAVGLQHFRERALFALEGRGPRRGPQTDGPDLERDVRS